MKAQAILISRNDNVATALADIRAGEKIAVKTDDDHIFLDADMPVPFGHKFAVRNIARGDNIIKYGEIIGRATDDITTGSHAHVQNIESLRGRGDKET